MILKHLKILRKIQSMLKILTLMSNPNHNKNLIDYKVSRNAWRPLRQYLSRIRQKRHKLRNYEERAKINSRKFFRKKEGHHQDLLLLKEKRKPLLGRETM